MIDERKASLIDETVEKAVRTMAERPVPEGFSARVMASLEPRRVSPVTRLRLWLTRPRYVAFTPLKAFPALALAIAVLFVALWPAGPGEAPREGAPAVRFVLYDADRSAHSVAVIGSFNNWQPTSSMRYDPAAGAWVMETQLPPGEYEYVFVLDGERIMPDPRAQASRNDGFGNTNSIIYVGNHEQML